MDLIKVTMDSNEAGSKRAAGLALALTDDPRFEWRGYESIPVDLCFTLQNPASYDRGFHQPEPESTLYFLVELKESADYVASALGPTGHLYSQVLTMRESGHPCMVLVLGSDEDVNMAVKDALVTRYRGKELGYQIASYNDRLHDFEAQAHSLGVPVMRWKATPWKRLLSHAHKILTGGNLLDYRPRPANGERELAAAAMLLGNGIGCKVLEPVLEHYRLMLVPKGDLTPVGSLPGIGPKRTETINQRIYGAKA